MEQVRSNGEQKELRDEIVDLGTRYGIVTPYTSYLALEPNAVVTSSVVGGQRNNRGFMAGAGRGAADAPHPSPAPSAADAKAVTGLAAVRQSRTAREQQEAFKLDKDTASSAIKNVGGKTFYLRDDVWTDSEFKAGTAIGTEVKFGSDKYFELLKQNPRLGEFFALGEQVVVVFNGHVYKVTKATP